MRELKKTINEAFNGEITPSKKILKCCPEQPLSLRNDPRFGFPVKQQMSYNILSTVTVHNYFSKFKLKSLKACFATCNVSNALTTSGFVTLDVKLFDVRHVFVNCAYSYPHTVVLLNIFQVYLD